MIRDMGLESMSGLIKESIMGNGLMGSSRAKECLYLGMSKRGWGNGRMEIERDGLYSVSRKTSYSWILNWRSI